MLHVKRASSHRVSFFVWLKRRETCHFRDGYSCRVEITNNCHKNPKQAHHAHEEEKMVFGVCVCEDARDQLSNFFLHPRPSPHAAKSARASQAQGSSKKSVHYSKKFERQTGSIV